GLSVSDFLQRVRPDARMPLFAVIDQFESVFGHGVGEAHRRELIDQLVAAVRLVPRLHLLVSTREDQLAGLAEFAELAGLAELPGGTGRFRLGPFGTQAALEAVVGPLRGTGQAY